MRKTVDAKIGRICLRCENYRPMRINGKLEACTGSCAAKVKAPGFSCMGTCEKYKEAKTMMSALIDELAKINTRKRIEKICKECKRQGKCKENNCREFNIQFDFILGVYTEKYLGI